MGGSSTGGSGRAASPPHRDAEGPTGTASVRQAIAECMAENPGIAAEPVAAGLQWVAVHSWTHPLQPVRPGAA